MEASDILALTPTPHTAPILGVEDEDAIITERRAEAEGELAAILADPARAAVALTDEFALSVPHVTGNTQAHVAREEGSFSSLTDQEQAARQGAAAAAVRELVPTEERR